MFVIYGAMIPKTSSLNARPVTKRIGVESEYGDSIVGALWGTGLAFIDTFQRCAFNAHQGETRHKRCAFNAHSYLELCKNSTSSV